jgi:hypothetical protein
MAKQLAKLRLDANELAFRTVRVALGVTLGIGAPYAAAAQVAATRDTVSTIIVGRDESAQVAISYVRPRLLGRAVLGGIIPESVAWPIGAGDVATLTTVRPLMVGKLRVPPGTYALWLNVAPGAATLIVSRRIGLDANSYDKTADLGSVEMTVDTLASAVEQLTIAFATQRFGPDTVGIEINAKKSRGYAQYETMIERPGTTRSLVIMWDRLRWSARVDAVGELARR